MKFFIPEKVIVFREALSSDDVRGTVVQDNKYGSSSKSKFKKIVGQGRWMNALEMDNKPQSGWGIISFGSGRYKSSNDLWYLMHPLGFTVAVSSSCFNDIISNSTIQDGIIETELQFVSFQESTTGPTVRSVRSLDYKNARTEAEEFKLTSSDVKPFDVIILKRDPTPVVYLGAWHMISNEQLTLARNSAGAHVAKSQRRHVFSRLKGYPKVGTILNNPQQYETNYNTDVMNFTSSTSMEVGSIVGSLDPDLHENLFVELEGLNSNSLNCRITGGSYGTSYGCISTKPFTTDGLKYKYKRKTELNSSTHIDMLTDNYKTTDIAVSISSDDGRGDPDVVIWSKFNRLYSYRSNWDLCFDGHRSDAVCEYEIDGTGEQFFKSFDIVQSSNISISHINTNKSDMHNRGTTLTGTFNSSKALFSVSGSKIKPKYNIDTYRSYVCAPTYEILSTKTKKPKTI